MTAAKQRSRATKTTTPHDPLEARRATQEAKARVRASQRALKERREADEAAAAARAPPPAESAAARALRERLRATREELAPKVEEFYRELSREPRRLAFARDVAARLTYSWAADPALRAYLEPAPAAAPPAVEAA